MVELMALLSTPAFEGYPTEYLLARLRGRRVNFGSVPFNTAEWTETEPSLRYRAEAGGTTGTEAWHTMRAEYRWVYRQMNEGLRHTFAPLFLWFEVRIILLSLRFRGGGDRKKAAGLLATSLLAEQVQSVLAGEGAPTAVIDAVAGLMAAVAEPYRNIGNFYRERGNREFEQRLVTLYLERMSDLPLHPVLREFFRSVIDMRNLIALAKQIRWHLNEPGAFIRGGEIPPERFGKALEEGTAGLATLLGALPGMGTLPAASGNPEPLLLHWLTRKVRRLGRDPLGIGLVLDYLWRCFITAHNLSLILQCEDVEPASVRAELIG